MLCGDPDGASVRGVRSYPKRVACGKVDAMSGTPTFRVMSDGELMVTVEVPPSELPIAGAEETATSSGHGSTSWRWIGLPLFGSVPFATITISPPQPTRGWGPAGSTRK